MVIAHNRIVEAAADANGMAVTHAGRAPAPPLDMVLAHNLIVLRPGLRGWADGFRAFGTNGLALLGNTVDLNGVVSANGIDVEGASGTTIVHDTISGVTGAYPQCDQSYPASGAFRVVGVNGGLAFNPNPCLASELAWANIAGGARLYANTGNPGARALQPLAHRPAHPAAVRGREPRHCGVCLRLRLRRRGRLVPDCGDRVHGGGPAGVLGGEATWWLDVETGNSWRTNVALNVADLQGAVDYLTTVAKVARPASTRARPSGSRSRVAPRCSPRSHRGSPDRAAREVPASTARAQASRAVPSPMPSSLRAAPTVTCNASPDPLRPSAPTLEQPRTPRSPWRVATGTISFGTPARKYTYRCGAGRL